jgi:acyl-CoA thioesterase-2
LELSGIYHALWLHEPARADAWLRLDLEPWKATPGRALYRGVLRDEAGRVTGIAARESGVEFLRASKVER